MSASSMPASADYARSQGWTLWAPSADSGGGGGGGLVTLPRMREFGGRLDDSFPTFDSPPPFFFQSRDQLEHTNSNLYAWASPQ